MKIARLPVFLLVLNVLFGCKAQTDVGKECILTKRDPAHDGGSLFVTEGDIKSGANKDFISFGSTDCDELVCVRDAKFNAASDGGVAMAPDPKANAKGYCSKRCASEGTECATADDDPNKKVFCRALLLDAETLDAICQADPDTCTIAFGHTQSPFFCARGSADGG